MIQRIQTVWLFLAAIFGFLFTQVPIYVASIAGNVVKKFVPTESLLLFASCIAVALLALICIFLFKNRLLQFKLSVIGFLASIGLIALEVWQIEGFKDSNSIMKGSYYWGSLVPIAMSVFFIIAASKIRKDEKLVKSLDRLR
jgi:FtsH-binding integral membrane protein